MRIYLIGMPGSGKSTLGKQLAKRLGYQFVDLDELIVQVAGHPITEIFARQGEDGFRRLERDILKQTATLENTVIATGGGTPCFFDNAAWMNRHGKAVFIHTPLPVIAERIYRTSAEKQKRPLFAGKSREQVWETLNEMYQKGFLFTRKPLFVFPEMISRLKNW